MFLFAYEIYLCMVRGKIKRSKIQASFKQHLWAIVKDI